MGSLLNSAPALFVLETAVVVIHCRQIGLNLYMGAAAAALFIAPQALIAERNWSERRRCLLLIVILLGLTVSFCAVVGLERETPLPRRVSGVFTVVGRRLWGEGSMLGLEGEDGGRWIARASGALEDAEEGNRYSLSAAVLPLRNESGRSSFSPRKYWMARGFHGELRGVEVSERFDPVFSVHLLRQMLRRRIRLLPGTAKGLFAAMLLGDRDPNLSEMFRRWGISHYLAVSGWHVGLAVMLASFLVGKKRYGLVLSSLLLWFYCLISGCSISALRATLMLQIGLAGLWIGSGTAALNAVGLAGVAMLLRNPWTYFDLGWRLSILAAMLAVGLYKTKTLFLPILAPLAMLVVMSPFIAPIAGGIYFSSLPNNVLATVLFSFVLVAVLISGLPVLVGLPLFFPVLCSLELFDLWAFAADRLTDWFPQALPSGFFPAALCGGLAFLLTARAVRISFWRCLLLSLSGGFMVWTLFV